MFGACAHAPVFLSSLTKLEIYWGQRVLLYSIFVPLPAIQGRNATGQVGFSSQTRACLLVSGAFAPKMPVACTSPLFNEFHSFEGRIWIWKFSMIFKL